MPTYDYECQGCGHEFEKFQNMSANSLRKCPECGERKLQRLIGPGAGVIFKGSGFYETDYRSDSYKKAASKDTENASKSDSTTSKSDKSGDSAPKSDSSKPDSSKPEASGSGSSKPVKSD